MLSQFYDPEPGPAALPGVLARGLAERGHSVRVVTGFPNYPTGALAPGYRVSRRTDERLDGVDVVRVALYPNHGTSGARRLANYASFGASATSNGVAALRDMDAVWVNCSPITLAWPMWALRGLRVPMVSHVLDLWPDSFYATGFGERFREGAASGLLDRWTISMYRVSHSVAYISPSVGDLLAERGVPRDKLHYVPMWADETRFRPATPDRAAWEIPDDAVALLYAGAIGDAQGIDTLVAACREIADPRFVCLIAGSGTAESAVRAQAADVPNVRLLGRVPQEQMTSLMASVDASYISLRPHPLARFSIPSKTQAALAAGKPVVVASDGDVIDVIRASGAGFTARQDDPSSIVAAIRGLLEAGDEGRARAGAAGRRYYEQQFSAGTGIERVEVLLQDAAGTRRRS